MSSAVVALGLGEQFVASDPLQDAPACEYGL